MSIFTIKYKVCILFIGFFDGYLICSVNKSHSNLNIFKVLRTLDIN